MKNTVDAVFERGQFRPLNPEELTLREGEHVRLTVESEPTDASPLDLALRVYEGLSPSEIDEVERIATDRTHFFGADAPE